MLEKRRIHQIISMNQQVHLSMSCILALRTISHLQRLSFNKLSYYCYHISSGVIEEQTKNCRNCCRCYEKEVNDTTTLNSIL